MTDRPGDTCPTCGVTDRSTMTHCSDGFHAPGETYWPTITVDDRELIERLGLHKSWRDSHGELNDAPNLARDRLQSLLSLLERVWACRADVGKGRFVNLEKLWPVIDDIGVVLIQTEVP